MIKVILTEDVPDLGRAGDVCAVSDGYARNCLLKNKLAVVATPEKIAQHEERIAKERQRREERRKRAERIVKLLDGKTVSLTAKDDHGTLFAAITEKDIAGELSELSGEEVPLEVIKLEKSIKKVGEHKVVLDFGEGICATVRLTVEGRS